MKQFQVWLDESGGFNDTPYSNEIYSFIGGVLIDAEISSKDSWKKLLADKNLNHAMDLSMTNKKKRVLPILQEFKRMTESSFVFFENIEYTGIGDNRGLYLEIFAEGILQLLEYLESKYGVVQLSMTVASRTVPGSGHIYEKEYKMYFDALLEKRRKRNETVLQKDSSVSFHLERGTESKKLIVADFASHIRRQYLRKAKEFQDPAIQKILKELFIDSLVFSRSELSSDKRVRILLSQGDISEALMEIFTSDTLGLKDREYYLRFALERMLHLSYRLIKSQLKQLSSEVLAYVARQEDYQQMIAFLSRVQRELLPRLKAGGHPYEQFQFEVCLQLSDVYLRAGQFQQAGLVLDDSLKLVEETDSSLENVFTLYRIYEKLAVFYIDSFQYKRASDLMLELRRIYTDLLEWLETYPTITHFFKNLKSEYYGDVLCMEIYALLFQASHTKDVIEEARGLSDIALTQYPSSQGELERHRQYRSRLEQKAGRIEEAMSWLIQSIHFEQPPSSPITEEVLTVFWDKVESQETPLSQEFFIMYYLLVMTSAKQLNHPLAAVLHKCFSQHSLPKRLIAEASGQETVLLESKEFAYHPREISYWYLADYYRLDGKEKASLRYYDKAIAICCSGQASLTLKLRMIGILAAKASLQLSKVSDKSIRSIIVRIQAIRKELGETSPQLEGTFTLLEKWEKELGDMAKEEAQLADNLWQFALKWRY